MAIDYEKLGKRISSFRSQADISQDELSNKLHLSREYVSYIETGKRKPSLDSLVDIANTLHISIDDLLVDSLLYSTSTANTDIHKLLLDCTETEAEILTRMVKELKAILSGVGI